MNRDSLLPFTKLVLLVSAVVQFIFGIVGEFFTGVFNSFFWTAPLTPWPADIARFAFLNYLATAIAAVYALKQGSWRGARVYFAFSMAYNIMSLVVSFMTAAAPGLPPIHWVYVLLALIYVPAVLYTWRAQERQP